MYLDRHRFRLAFLVLVMLDLTVLALFVASRRPFTNQQWAFLEGQRPRVTRTANGISVNFAVCADCLDFAIARRAFGGWESGFGHLLEIANAPAILVARESFHSLQSRSSGTSQSNSDFATGIFSVVAILECAVVAVAVSVRTPRPAPAG